MVFWWEILFCSLKESQLLPMGLDICWLLLRIFDWRCTACSWNWSKSLKISAQNVSLIWRSLPCLRRMKVSSCLPTLVVNYSFTVYKKVSSLFWLSNLHTISSQISIFQWHLSVRFILFFVSTYKEMHSLEIVLFSLFLLLILFGSSRCITLNWTLISFGKECTIGRQNRQLVVGFLGARPIFRLLQGTSRATNWFSTILSIISFSLWP